MEQLLKSPHGEPGERRRRVMFVEIQFPKTPSSVRCGIKSRKPILPCRSSGTSDRLKAGFYTHLAPSGALPQQRDQLFNSAGWSQALAAWDAVARCVEQSLIANPGRPGF
jgi:hypothetical protein